MSLQKRVNIFLPKAIYLSAYLSIIYSFSPVLMSQYLFHGQLSINRYDFSIFCTVLFC
uniref:Uncharacterized protein n=1 Tax=Octopus bimaculoides TaxID=37653 RepID=A0A0L8I8J0_OCTBM